MTDIARIGFKADTNELDKAVLTLNKLNAASKGVATSTNQVSKVVQGSSLAMAQAAADVARAVTLKGQANLKALQTSKNVAKAEIEQAQAALKSAKAEEANARSILATAKANERLHKIEMSMKTSRSGAFNRAATGGPSRGPVATGVRIGSPGDAARPRDLMPNRFNTANIAAQFQDIGVTAAMGMNPLTVALQQGTQLSAILNSMESPLKGLKDAFKSIINPVSLISIALTGLVVALIQFVNWAKVGQTLLDGLGSVLQASAGFMSVLAQGALIFGSALSVAVVAVGAYNAAMALFALTTTAGRAALMGQIAAIWGYVSATAAAVAASVAAGAKMAAAWIIAGGPIVWITTGIIAIIAALGTLAVALDATMGSGLVQGLKTAINSVIGAFLGAFKGIGAAAVAMWNKILRKDGPTDMGKAFADAFRESLGTDYLGAAGEVVKTGLSEVGAKLKAYAAGMGASGGEGGAKGGKTPTEQYEDIIAAAKRRVSTLRAEQAAIGLTEEAAAKLKYEQDLLNQAMQKNIELSPAQRKELEALAGTMAKIEEETRKAKEAIDFAKDTTKGFFSDLRGSIQEGKSLWESFANAAVNAINKILDRMMDMAINDLFSGFSSNNKKSGGGFLGSIFSGIGSFLLSAKGNVFDTSGVQKFAKGGMFTNSVVSSPTMFKFANGGAFGMMGEAGPEAVMPLHRGSDGSLGVKMNGGGSSGDNITYNIDARGAAPGVEEDIKRALYEVDKLRKDTPKIAIESIKDANNRNLGLLR